MTATSLTIESPAIWPPRFDVLGVEVSATTYDEAAEVILDAARRRVPALVDHLSAHGIALANRDAAILDWIADVAWHQYLPFFLRLRRFFLAISASSCCRVPTY